MTHAIALTADVSTLTVPELDAARGLIGEAKLIARQAALPGRPVRSVGELHRAIGTILPVLKPLNARLDVVNAESDDRQSRRRTK